MSLRLSIVMPAFNEEDCIEQTVTEALGVLDELGPDAGEVVVVDDGSTDATPELLAGLAAADARVRVVRHEVNQGISGFNRRMMQEARGEWVLFTSSDGDFDPREGLRFMDLAEAHDADAVLGYRQSKHYNAWRLAVSWSFNVLTRLCFGEHFRDIGSIRLLRRSAFQSLPLYSHSAFLNAERLLVGRKRGARILQVPTAHRRRLAGRGGGARPRRVARALADLWRTRARWFDFERFYG